MDHKSTVSTACQLNIDGLSSHSTTALDNFISDNSVDILALQEVGQRNLPADQFVNKITFSSHSIKGVSLSVANKHKPQLISELHCDEVDAIFVLCSIGKASVVLASCYCRPEISSTRSLRLLLSRLENAWRWCKKNKVKSMVAYGDFNARNCAWGDVINNPRGKLLRDHVESAGDILLHSAGSNTFLHSNGGSVIDVSLTYGEIQSSISNPWTEHCYTLFTGAPQKGHIPVLQNFVMRASAKDTRRQVPNFDDADWFSWHYEAKKIFKDANDLTFDEPLQMFQLFLQVIDKCSRQYIPTKTVCKHSKPFWTQNLSVLSKQLQDVQKKYKRRSDPLLKSVLEKSKSHFQETLMQEKNDWIHRKLEGLNTRDSLEFWKRYKKQFAPKSDNFIGHLRKDGNSSSLTNSEQEKEEVLYRSFFTGAHLDGNDFDSDWMLTMQKEVQSLKERNWDIDSGTQNDRSQENPLSESKLLNETFLNGSVTCEEVVHSIQLQKTAGKCKDMDQIHPLILKKLPGEAIVFLTKMYNMALDKGQWPWDMSAVSFIRKPDKDSYLLPGSFRPISIASYVSKIFERVLQKRLLLYCQQAKVIDDSQEGFLPQRSTTRYLYKMTAAVAEARRRKLSTILLFLDFEKAFDSVSTTAMIFKLNQHGISGKFLRLIDRFLTDRSVSLRVNDYKGPRRRVGLFGLPQGSVLSPLLFVIFVSDLLHNVHLLPGQLGSASSFKYADDGSVMASASSTTQCYDIMQQICNTLTAWCKRWHLAINCSKNKTEAIIVKSHDSGTTSLQKLVISGKQVEYVQKSKVLGVVFDANVSFEHHARLVVKSCWYRWHQLSDRTTRKRGLNCSTLALLFKTAIQTKLMYASSIWLLKNIEIFKNFMFRSLFKISGSQYYPPKSVLEVIFGLPPLQLSLEIMTVKFILKSLSVDDELKAVLLQIEESPSHPFYRHIMWTKTYLAWKDGDGDRSQRRTITLLDSTSESMMYTQGEMNSYLCSRWDLLICNNDLKHFQCRQAQSIVSEDLIHTDVIIQNPLFRRGETRENDTNVVDFLHGHGLRFEDFRNAVTSGTTVETCKDCTAFADSPEHKLFLCAAFSGEIRDQLISLLDDDFYQYRVKIVFSKSEILRRTFRKMVEYICNNSAVGDYYRQSSQG